MNSGGIEVAPRQRVIVDCICGCVNQFHREELDRVFEGFNAIGNHELQNAYLRGCMEISRWENFANGGGRNVFVYRIKLLNRTLTVCQKFFLGAHGIGQSRLRHKVEIPDLYPSTKAATIM